MVLQFLRPPRQLGGLSRGREFGRLHKTRALILSEPVD
jgi:hypothetical protein